MAKSSALFASNLKLQSRILLGYSIPILLMILASSLVFSNVKKLETTAQNLEISNQSVRELKNFNIEFFRMQKSARGYLISQERKFFAEYTGAVEAANEDIEDLDVLVENNNQIEILVEVEELIGEIDEGYLSSFDLNSQGQGDEASALWARQVVPRLERVEELTEQFEEREQAQYAILDAEQKDALQFLIVAVIASTILAAILAVLLGLWIAKGITQTIDEAAGTIASSSTQMSSTVEEQERIANQQAASVNQTTTTMEELGVSSRQSAEQVESVAVGAHQASDLAKGGTLAVERTLNGMASLKDAVEGIADHIARLSERTQQIGTISTLVSDMANQTNMLALNAAVEAVRAGEHGKGFSVVANEIRKLADRSKQSAEKINDLVSEIQTSIQSTSVVAEAGTQTVKEGVEIARETEQAFTGVAEAINNIVFSTQQISLNASQQATAIQQMVDAMNSINSGVSETASGLSQTKVGVRDLTKVALDLKAIV